jgi:hypothetical protein
MRAAALLATLATLATAAYAQTTANRCGVDYADAAAKCDDATPCPLGDSAPCPKGTICFSQVTCPIITRER